MSFHAIEHCHRHHHHHPHREGWSHQGGSRLRHRLFWGIALVAGGILMLLARSGIVPGLQAWTAGFGLAHGLALLLMLSGLARIFAATQVRHVLNGAGRLALGGWVLACLARIGGWTFASSWPVLLIVWGLLTLAGTLWRARRPAGDLAS